MWTINTYFKKVIKMFKYIYTNVININLYKTIIMNINELINARNVSI